ncbi:cation channel sperm-associated auxiliary subunit TMEM262 [Pogona vitticeps]|uniref:Cation channel sperm-associated auxiliary subunit TMEM262 n=1 Tax=Pogona vitticeps TaxID=103695 RepID=A0A6J0SE65_9SAUR
MPTWKDRFITLTFPKKVIFTVGSLFLCFIHAAVIVSDLYHFLVTQNVDLMSFRFTVVLLFSHVLSFYWAVLATIYTLLGKDNVLIYFALTSLAMNFAMCLARFSMDYITIEYREEQY